jgi:hypothetical protein
MNYVVRLFSVMSVLAIAGTQLPSAFAQGCGGNPMFGDGKPGRGPKFSRNFNGNGNGSWWKNQMGQTGLGGGFAPWQQQYQGAYGAPWQQQYQGAYGGGYGAPWQQNVYGSLMSQNGYQNLFSQQMASPQMLAWRQQLVQQFDINRNGRLDKAEKSQLRQHVRNLIASRQSGQGIFGSNPQIAPYAAFTGNQFQNVGGFRARRGRI